MDPTRDDLDTLIADFRKSEFLQAMTRHWRELQDEAVRKAEAEVSHLRTENAQLRAQFARSAMELPGQSLKESPKEEEAVGQHPTGASNLSFISSQKTAEKNPVRHGESIGTEAEVEFSAGGRQKSAVEAVVALVTEPRRHDVFPDKEAMKQAVRKAIQRPQTNVQSFYHSTGWAQYIARLPMFEYVTLAVIAINAGWIAVDADLNPSDVLSDAPVGFQIVENLFCVFFLAEWLVRLCALESKLMGMRHDSWFVFDFLLLLPMVAETWVTPLILKVTNTKMDGNLSNTSILKVVRISKIVRMARMVRLLRSCPELLVLIKGIWMATKSVFFTLFLLMIVVYVFAVAFRQTTEGTATGDKYFRNVPEAMRTLLLDGVIPDLADFMNQVGKESIWYALFLMVFILLASVTVMNMLIGVLVQVVSVVSSVESEQMKVNFVKQRLMRMLNLNEADLRQEDMYISRKEFEMLLTEPEGAKAMQDIGVDPVGLVDFGDYIFSKGTKGEGRRKGKGDAGDYISFGKFIEIMLQFRGTNTCTVRDIVDMRKVMSYEMQEILSALNLVIVQVQSLDGGNNALGGLSLPRPDHRSKAVSSANMLENEIPGMAWGRSIVRPASDKKKHDPSSGASKLESKIVSRIEVPEIRDATDLEDCAVVEVQDFELPPHPSSARSARSGATAIVPAWSG